MSEKAPNLSSKDLNNIPERYTDQTEVHNDSLQVILINFAAAPLEAQKARLGGLLTLISKAATEEEMMQNIDPEVQSRLQKAVESAFATPLDIDGEEVLPWKGSATVVALDERGRIVAAISNRPEDMRAYDHEAFNFFAPALSKAVVSMYLHNAGIQGGISDNRRYLKEITNGAFKVHMGATDSPLDIGGVTGIYLGNSGCEVISQAVSKALDGATPAYFTQAGAFDEAFVGLTGDYLQDVTKPVQLTTPPRAIERLIAGN